MKKGKLSSIALIIGIVLVVVSLGFLVFSLVSQGIAAANARELVIELRQLMPQVRPGEIDDRVNVDMASMEVKGSSFCGIIEIPAYNTDLPIRSSWDVSVLSQFPCRFSGSVYDRTLIIGGSDQASQFDFMKEITVDDRIYVTDMTGSRYSYKVVDIVRTKDVSAENLMAQNADLVLFARNTYGFDYTLVLCNLG